LLHYFIHSFEGESYVGEWRGGKMHGRGVSNIIMLFDAILGYYSISFYMCRFSGIETEQRMKGNGRMISGQYCSISLMFSVTLFI